MITQPEIDKKDNPHYHGHRDRLRAKLRQVGGAGLADYELLELLLMAAIPRKDVKPLAKDLLKHFGGLDNVLSASTEKLEEAGLSANAASLVLLVKEIAIQYRKTQVTKQSFSDTRALLDYLYAKLGGLTHEEFHVLYLDSKNQLLADKNHFQGTVNASAVYPREVMKAALDLGAVRLIMVHNHPSGDPSPSPEDHTLTRDMAQLAANLEIDVYDHLIIGAGKHFSFRDEGYL